MDVLLGLLIPFAGTALGAAAVFMLKNEPDKRFEKLLLGFAAGVMIAASVWSLIIPAIEMSGKGIAAVVPATVGFLLGIAFLMLIDAVIPHLRRCAQTVNRKTAMTVFAITLHNIPEGMAVGVIIAGAIIGNAVSMAGALALSIGIAIQNLPEGAIVSMPLTANGCKKSKAFRLGVLSGIVEPIAGAITLLLSALITPVLPYLLSFAAGAMVYVVVAELIPESRCNCHKRTATAGFALGFTLMMVLDVLLG